MSVWWKRESDYDPGPMVARRGKPVSVKAQLQAAMTVALPAGEVDFTKTYTFEADHDGISYRWTGRRPYRVGTEAVFDLRGGVRITPECG